MVTRSYWQVLLNSQPTDQPGLDRKLSQLADN